MSSGARPLRQSAAEVVIEFVEAAFAYGGVPVVTGVTGSVECGGGLALVGPNGSGKTTLLRSVIGMVDIVSGSVRVLGAAPGRTRPGAIAYVPQSSDLDPTFPVTALSVVLMGTYPELGILRRPGREQRLRCREALKAVGLAQAADRRFGTLSGGQQQRVLLARAIASRPQIVLLDEPFNGLDQPNRDALLRIVSDLKEAGVTVVVSTHDLVLARAVCEQVVLLAGRQIAFGPRQTVLVPRYIDEAFGKAAAKTLLPSGAAAVDRGPGTAPAQRVGPGAQP
ncbi:metal ABC transporter ATP-binding protein [Actinomyces qiguomingii]|uniref:metal ABC transporter ATP-binding protein n=1 Tax=Actinomyces qiguomingii TaxID=2057800 RepID=UPI000CA02673|nr:metal ABC transporter ATP-binding protein [Actinomyces qiguomingii]